MRVNRQEALGAEHWGALVGELGEILVVPALLLCDGDQVAALVVRRGQLHALTGELGVKVPGKRLL